MAASIIKLPLWLAAMACLLSCSHESSPASITRQTIRFSGSGGSTVQNRASKTRSTILSHFHQTEHNEAAGPGFRAELIQRDSPLSSLSGSIPPTRAERLKLAVKRSRARAKALSAIATTKDKLSSSSSSSSRRSKITPHDLAFTSPVASASGAYVMKLQLGTPAQSFEAIADTGSDLVWLQCNPCTHCYRQQGSLFSPSSSSTYSKLSCSSQQCRRLSSTSCSSSSTCTYVYQYGDSSSTRGDFSTDTITMTTTDGSTQRIPTFSFGCGHNNDGTFGGAGGLVGLGQGTISLTSQLGSLIQNRFSYCLVSFDDAASKTSPLLFGSAASLSESSIKSTPIQQQGSTYYYVGLGGVSVGGQDLGVSFTGGTILDSGTTLTLLEDSVYSAVESAFQSAISLPTVDGSSYGLDLCYDVTGLTSYQVPTLSLHLTDSDLDPPAANYFILADTNTLCLAMGSSSGLGLSIIGNIMQQNYHILYDRGASTISFAPRQCDTL